ncbi:MAG: carboxypeptidase regulatory-like domain-containing protein, partial [Armatimonadetes bacterium]|nr:carboxypeptidase regulatory-like domain-containing protein [Armatimonadota bacterium]
MRLRPFCALSPALPLLVALAGCGGHSERAEVRGEAAAEAPTAYGILPHSGRITVDDLTVGGTGGISGQARSASGGPRGNARITVSLVALREDGSVEDRPLAVDAAVRTSASGWYGFANVPPGRWRMRCRNADG